MDNFILRQFNTYTDPKYVGWSSTDTHPVTYSTTSSRIRVVDLGKVNYTYHVKNLKGNVAVKATIEQYIGTMLRTWEDIPNIIRSPFLAPSYNATVTYKDGNDNVITAAPYNTAGSNIYVTYIYSPSLSGGTFNVKTAMKNTSTHQEQALTVRTTSLQRAGRQHCIPMGT